MTKRYWHQWILGAVLLATAVGLAGVAQPAPPNIYRIKVEIQGQGTVSLTPEGTLSGGIYWYSSTGPIDVTATAAPASGWAFKEWQGRAADPPGGWRTRPGGPPGITSSGTDSAGIVKKVFVAE